MIQTNRDARCPAEACRAESPCVATVWTPKYFITQLPPDLKLPNISPHDTEIRFQSNEPSKRKGPAMFA